MSSHGEKSKEANNKERGTFRNHEKDWRNTLDEGEHHAEHNLHSEHVHLGVVLAGGSAPVAAAPPV